MFLLCVAGLPLSTIHAQKKEIIDDEAPNGIVIVTIDKAGDEIIRIMNESQLPYIHDPKAPRFLLMDKQGKFALGIGGYVRATGEYDFGGIVDDIDFVPANIPSSSKIKNQFQMDASTATIFLKLVGHTRLLGDFTVYTAGNFRGGDKTFQLRNAYMSFRNITVGYTYGGFITVVRVPAYSPYAVAEYTVALMLSLNRKIPRATWRTRDGNFSLHGLLGFDMYGKTAGIIGTGKIAKKLICILRGFGMNILAYDLYPDYNFAREHQVVYTSLDELYHNSDIISLHCPLTEQTKYLINDYSISKMKDGVMIINTGRGQLIHTNALIEGLKNKKIGSAGLDVYEEESEYFYEDQSDKIIDDYTKKISETTKNVYSRTNKVFGLGVDYKF